MMMMTGDIPPLPTVTPRQLIDLVGGAILLLAAYYAFQSRRSQYEAYRREYGRAAVQTVAGYLVLSYASFVLWPSSEAWPVQTGYHLYAFFEQFETVPAKADTQLTDYYLVLLRQIGYATGASPSPLPGALGMVEGGVRTVGLVIYSTVFTLISLGAQVPGRIVGGVTICCTTKSHEKVLSRRLQPGDRVLQEAASANWDSSGSKTR